MSKENKEFDFIRTMQLGFENNIINIVGAGLSLNLLAYSAFEASRYGADELVILKVATGMILGIACLANSLIEGKDKLKNSKNDLPTNNRS